MLLCIHVHNGTSTLGHLYSWDTSTRRLFSWSWQNSQLRSDKLCIYHLYYKGTSMRRLGHFLSAASAISAPIKETTTKLPMITMPSETLRCCSSFCISFKIKMNALCIFTVLSLILHLLTGYCSSNLVTRQITIIIQQSPRLLLKA